MRKFSPCMRRPLVIYDFATAPFWISLYMRKIWFSFLSVHNQINRASCALVVFKEWSWRRCMGYYRILSAGMPLIIYRAEITSGCNQYYPSFCANIYKVRIAGPEYPVLIYYDKVSIVLSLHWLIYFLSSFFQLQSEA